MTDTERFIQINKQILELYDRLNSAIRMTEKLTNAVTILTKAVQDHKHEIGRLNLRNNFGGDKK